MARKMSISGPREKMKIRRKGRHAKNAKRRDKKQTFFPSGVNR
jgi:hypothetical protein